MSRHERQELSREERFAILKRDEFACQYCGRKAPAVTLHIDHVVPVSAGGTNERSNLVTACEDCNIGKGVKRIDKKPHPQSVQQWQSEQHERDNILPIIVGRMRDLWWRLTHTRCTIPNGYLEQLINEYGPELVQRGIIRTAPKVQSAQVPPDKGYAYLCGVIRGIKNEPVPQWEAEIVRENLEPTRTEREKESRQERKRREKKEKFTVAQALAAPARNR